MTTTTPGTTTECFDKELEKVIATQYRKSQGLTEEIEDKVVIGPYSFEYTESIVPYSKVFNIKKPKIDIPINLFKPEDWHENVRSRIPTPDTNYILNRVYLDKIIFGMYCRGPILLYGETGTGKTSFAREIASRLNIPFFRISCHPQQEYTEFLGTNQVINDRGVPVTVHSHTDVTLAATYGGMLVVDEAFRSPILMAIQSLLEDKPCLQLQDALGIQRQLIPPNPFWIILTDNTNGTGDSSGNYISNIQDISTLNRIRTTIKFDYVHSDEEKKMLTKKFPTLPQECTKTIVKLAGEIRASFRMGKIQQAFSYRDSYNLAENILLTGDMAASFSMSYLNKLSNDDSILVTKIYTQITGESL